MLGSHMEEQARIVSPPLGNAVLELRDLHLAPKLDGVSLTLHQGEVLGIAGLLGSGRTELLQAVMGMARAD